MEHNESGVVAPLVKYRQIIMTEYLDYIHTYTELMKQINLYNAYNMDTYERYLEVVYSLRTKLRQYVKNKEKYELYQSVYIDITKARFYHKEILEIIRKLGLLNIDGLCKKTTINFDNYVKEQTGKSLWGIGEFMKKYSELCYKNNLDMHVIITGYEGSGKSALALSIASYIDETFEDNMQSRVAFHAKNITKYMKFLDEQSKLVSKGALEGMRCFVFDEAQNIYNARKAMHKENKKAIEIIRTQRYAKTGVFYCTPNILEIEKPVLDRCNILIIVDTSRTIAYGFIRAIPGKRFYYGRLDEFVDALSSYRKQKNKSLPSIPFLLSKLGIIFEFKGRTKINNKLYSMYGPLKTEESRKLYNEDDEKRRKKETKEEGADDRVVDKDYFEEIGFKVMDGGSGKTRDIIENKTIYLNDYYSYDAISSATGKSKSRLRDFKGWRKRRKGRYVYVFARDWIHLLE